MNENKTKTWLYVIITVIVSAVAVVFQTILNNYYIEAETGLYEYGAQTPSAFYIFMGVALFLTVTASFVLRRDSLPKELNYSSIFTSLVSTLVACSLIFLAVVYIMSNSGGATLLEKTAAFKLKNVCMYLSFPTAIYYFIVAFSGSSRSKFTAWFSFFPIIWTLSYLMSVYFDHSVLMNSPKRTLTEFALIILMLYQLYETRALIGKSKGVLYFILSNAAVIFLSAAFIPDVITFIKGDIRLSVDVLSSISIASMGLYVLSRAMSFAVHSDGEQVANKKSLKKWVAPGASAKDGLFEPEEDQD